MKIIGIGPGVYIGGRGVLSSSTCGRRVPVRTGLSEDDGGSRRVFIGAWLSEGTHANLSG